MVLLAVLICVLTTDNILRLDANLILLARCDNLLFSEKNRRHNFIKFREIFILLLIQNLSTM